MRVCLVSHGLPPYEITGVENYTLALARALARGGHTVEIFAARRAPELPNSSLRRELRDGYAITWVSANAPPRDPAEALDPPGIADAFARFLARERPEIVHFQHVIKLGLGLIERARTAGIPTVYTAHDYYAICHRVTLLRPDLARCATIGDAHACARCDLALALLNRRPELGDYQMGALPEQLDDVTRDDLARLLGGDEVGAGVHTDELAAARERRAALDERRRAVFAQVDLVLAPTEFLRDRLIEGGCARERVRVVPYGIECDDLRGLTPRAGERGGALHVGFLGGHAKHKGVHVLLDAWALLGARTDARLSIFGAGSDARYAERLREQAARVGADWRGPYDRADLPRVLAELDLVVVPSTWVENQPIVIREALAAGRPIVASRVGALPESVREGVDGWLFEPGDARDLARVLGAVLGAPDELRRVARALEPVKRVEAHVSELTDAYAELLAARPAPDVSSLPEHVRALALRHAELEALPLRELYANVLEGLASLRGVWDLTAPTSSELLVAAFAEGSRAQEFVDDGREERHWHDLLHKADETGLHALQDRVAWRERELAQRDQELAWLRDSRAVLETEQRWLRETSAALEAERDWLRGELVERERVIAWRVEQVTGFEREAQWRREQADGLERERAWLRDQIAARDAALASTRDAARARLRRCLERGAELARAFERSDGRPTERAHAQEALREQQRELQAAVDELEALADAARAPHEAPAHDAPMHADGAASPRDASAPLRDARASDEAGDRA